MLSMKKFDLSSHVSKSVEFDVIIGTNTTLEGTLKSGGSVRVDGQFTGDIDAEGDVIVGQEAVIVGNVKSSNIEISGHVTGDISSSGCLRIYSCGTLKGDIEVTSFIIDEGGMFEGMCHINTKKHQNTSQDQTPLRETPAEDQKPDMKLVK